MTKLIQSTDKVEVSSVSLSFPTDIKLNAKQWEKTLSATMLNQKKVLVSCQSVDNEYSLFVFDLEMQVLEPKG